MTRRLVNSSSIQRGGATSARVRVDLTRRIRRGFTLLEVVIVIAILAIIASMTIPRLLDHEERVFNLTCERIGDLLTVFAQRSSLGQTPIGIQFDADRRWLVVLIYDAGEDAFSGEARWRPDPFIQPVKLPPWETARLVEIRGDGRLADTTVWPLSTKPGQDRPSIEVILQGPAPANRTVSIVLPPYAVVPRQFDWSDPGAEELTSIDLTSIGRSRTDW